MNEPNLDPRQSGEMPFLAHLEELRRVLIHVVIACGIGAIVGWSFAPRVLETLIRRSVGHALVLSPLEAFNERFKLALLLGLLLSTPFVFYRVWRFVVGHVTELGRGETPPPRAPPGRSRAVTVST